MKIYVCASKHFYERIKPINNKKAEEIGHKITLPNSFKDPFKEEKMKKEGKEKHAEWKSKKIEIAK